MKKRFYILAHIIVVLLCFTGCSSGLNNTTSEAQTAKKDYIDVDSIAQIDDSPVQTEPNDGKCQVELYLLVEEHLVLDKYSVDVIVDGNRITTLSQEGVMEEIDLRLSSGSHTFRFEKSGDSSVFAETTEVVSGARSFQYGLERNGSNIDIKQKVKVDLSITVEKNIVKAKYAVNFYVDISGTYATTIADGNAGKAQKISVLLDKGTHSFYFCKNDDFTVLGKVTETFTDNGQYEISVKRHPDNIEIKSANKS